MAFSSRGSASNLRSELQKIDPSVKDVTRADGNYKVTYNDGFTRTLSPEGVSQIQSLYKIPTGQYDYDSETGNRLGQQYIYDYRLVKPEDIAKADINYVAPQAGFNPATYDVGSGVGLRKLQELLDLGASRQQIVDLFSKAPVIGERMQQLFPELQGLDPYTPVSGLTPEQLASYDVSTGIGMTKLEDLLNLGATPEQIAEIAGRAPVVGTRLQTLFPQFAPPPPPPPTPFSPSVPAFNYNVPAFNYNAPAFNYNVPSFNYGAPSAGLPALVPVSPVSLVQAAEAPTLSPSVQTVAGMKEGGLAAAARQVASAGRGGDTMLAHVTPEEAGILKALGGSGTINPKTGLPEYFIKFGRGGIDINIGKKSQQALAVAAGVGAGLGYIPSFIPGLSPVVSTALISGGISALGNQSLNQGIQAGLTAYGAGSITQAVAPNAASSAAGGASGSMSGGPAGVKAGTVTVNPSGAEALPGSYSSVGVESVPATVSTAPGAGFDQAIQDALYSPGGPGVPVDAVAYGDIPYESFGQTVAAPTPAQIAAQERVLYNPLFDPEVGGIADLSAPLEVQAVSPGNAAATAPTGFLGETLPASAQKYIPDPLLNASGTTLAAGTFLGAGLISGQQERQAYARLEAARKAEEEKKKREYLALFESTLGAVPVRSGGLMKLAGGGMTYMEAGGTTGPTGIPRDVTGTGDGMSDSVPATIEGVQEARLADGEFVIPADVVADIGNGSSDAGSKKLYDMMDRIREARHGTTKQPPEIDAEALMPA